MRIKTLIAIGVGLTIAITASAQSSSLWKLGSNNLAPVVSTWGLQINSLGSPSNPCVSVGSTGIFATTTCGGAGSVSSVSNSDGSLTVSPTTGVVVASLNPAHANTWTANQTFNNDRFVKFGTGGLVSVGYDTGNVAFTVDAGTEAINMVSSDFSVNSTGQISLTPTVSSYVYINGESRYSGSVIPGSNNSYDLGASGTKWRDFFLARNATIGGTLGVTGATTLATSLTGPLQAVSGLVSASSTLSTAYGGLGTNTVPTYGLVPVGNASGGYTPTATSSLGIVSGITALGPIGQTQTGSTQTLASSTTGTDFTITASGNTQTFNLPSASASARGLVTTGTQTFAGDKTLTGSTLTATTSVISLGTCALCVSSSTVANGFANLSVDTTGFGKVSIGGTTDSSFNADLSLTNVGNTRGISISKTYNTTVTTPVELGISSIYNQTAASTGGMFGILINPTDNRVITTTGADSGGLKPLSVSATRSATFNTKTTTNVFNAFTGSMTEQGNYTRSTAADALTDSAFNTVMTISPTYDDAQTGRTMTHNIYGSLITVSGTPVVTNATSTYNSHFYGHNLTGTIWTTGTTNASGFYTKLAGGDTMMEFHNDTANPNYLGGDNSKTYFGTGTNTLGSATGAIGDASISFDGTRMTIKSNEVTATDPLFIDSQAAGIASSTPMATLSVHALSGTSKPFIVAVATSTASATTTVFAIDNSGHQITGGATPGVSACGTSPTIAGNDTNWRVQVGSVLASSCTITFAAAFTTAPVCNVTQETGTAVAVVASSTPTAVVISGATFTSDWFVGHCEQY